MSEPLGSRRGSSAESIKRNQSEHEKSIHNEPISSPGFQLRRGRTPSSNIIGVLRELKDDIVDCNQACNNTGRSCIVSHKGPATGMSDVYVEQNGKFIKAPKELLENFDFNTRDIYLEELGPGYSTPLDVAILIEKVFSTVSRILLGILAGASLLTFILIVMLFNTGPNKDILDSWPFFAILSEVCRTLFFVMLTICLISIFDWMDLAHTNLQHMVDTFQRRKIGFVLMIYLSAMAAFLIAAPSNDFIIYNTPKTSSDGTESENQKGRQELLDNLGFWKTITLIYLFLCIFGWLFVTLSKNEDLFYIHLLGMKKYETSSQVAFQNQMAFNSFDH